MKKLVTFFGLLTLSLTVSLSAHAEKSAADFTKADVESLVDQLMNEDSIQLDVKFPKTDLLIRDLLIESATIPANPNPTDGSYAAKYYSEANIQYYSMF